MVKENLKTDLELETTTLGKASERPMNLSVRFSGRTVSRVMERSSVYAKGKEGQKGAKQNEQNKMYWILGPKIQKTAHNSDPTKTNYRRLRTFIQLLAQHGLHWHSSEHFFDS